MLGSAVDAPSDSDDTPRSPHQHVISIWVNLNGRTDSGRPRGSGLHTDPASGAKVWVDLAGLF